MVSPAAQEVPVAPAVRTIITGYLNKNNFPLTFSGIGETYRLEAGQWLADKKGQRLTDPMFLQFCGPGRLAVERCADPAQQLPGVYPDAPKSLMVDKSPEPEREDNAVDLGSLGSTIGTSPLPQEKAVDMARRATPPSPTQGAKIRIRQP